ncbi:MAG TPA: PP2C family protein-serine/threonine phosphatase, partial [Xanthomonadales bacterium]|nr:PP2C family protein-serine/threonine phosphatase [Xanthomonadales bacterium]
HNINATRPALRKLRLAASGDLYLIRKLSQSCVERLQSRSSERLRSRDVTVITDRFLRQEVFEYAPLVEAIRLIEEDPDLLACILQLLEHDSVPRSALPLPLSPDLDPLYLTGVLEIMEEEHYRVQNLIYRRFLTQHFSPGRVGHVLSMAGRWDAAIDYLEAGIQQGSGQSRADLLPATINSIYASEDLAQAVHFIQRGLAAAFGVSDSHIWFVPQQEKYLRLIGPSELSLDGETWANQQVDINADILEARAYRQQVPLRGHEGTGAAGEGDARVVRAIPLMIPGSKPIGVATIYDDLAGQSFGELRARDLQLVGFLNQAARALQTVSSRRQELVLAGKVQASLLPEALPAIPGWEMAADWRPARETAGDFYDVIHLPDGRLGIVMADVVDKGMGAALLMTLSRTLMRTFAAGHPDQPERLLGAVNKRIIADLDANLFVTLFYGVLDPGSGALVYSNAGHPPPYIFHPGGGAPVEALAATGMPLGIADDSRWNSAHTHVPSGGLLLLYTDGVLDAQSPKGEFFGQAPMLELVQAQSGSPAREIQDALMAAVYAFAANEPQVDDITLMLLARGSGA